MIAPEAGLFHIVVSSIGEPV